VKKMNKGIVVLLVLAVLAAAAMVLTSISSNRSSRRGDENPKTEVAGKPDRKRVAEPEKPSAIKERGREEVPDAFGEPDEELQDPPMTEEEKREAEEVRLVDEFDAETDKWMDAENTTPPTMKEIDAFHEKFRSLPEARKDECLHRALNLLPDENIMLLVGILMDKSENKEYIELIYNDVLNRDESVKKPILHQIFKDKSHPCWADTAWIFDVTDEKP